ncbi:MAG TPA: hypothetical protein VFZ09_47505 [Archangium sp.]|uniref:hypothetical protein n=1 Tax=Archangium sp. TaxID=1872627 RepID=UPI002E36B953|nr:hypothetical protein [Archangium sp.]HEX5753923.1 hypothetical protein [Archangium sp.]
MSRWARVSGGLIILLGLAHLALAVPDGVRAVAPLPREDAAALIMADIVTAVAVLLAGWLMLQGASGLGRAERWARTVVSSAGGFMVLVGVGYILATLGNPFAYVALLVALSSLVPPFLASRRSGGEPSRGPQGPRRA